MNGQSEGLSIMSVAGKPLFGGVLSEIHGCCFATGWRHSAFSDLLEQPTVSALLARYRRGADEEPAGFILCRSAAGEAEIITFCVLPKDRGVGIGRALLVAAIDQLSQDGIGELHLEVEQGNNAAISLYESAGFQKTGRRQGYYRSGADSGDAILMARSL